MPFSGSSAQSETQAALSGIRTWVTDSIFYDDNVYAKRARYVYFCKSQPSKWFLLLSYLKICQTKIIEQKQTC